MLAPPVGTTITLGSLLPCEEWLQENMCVRRKGEWMLDREWERRVQRVGVGGTNVDLGGVAIPMTEKSMVEGGLYPLGPVGTGGIVTLPLS